MFANYEKKIIEMTKSESKAAGKVGTTEYETLKELRSENPTFRIVIKASKSRDNMKGLDTNYMERYIKAHDNSEDKAVLKEFYSLRGLDAIHDTVHEMARDEARHGKALKGLLERYFK